MLSDPFEIYVDVTGDLYVADAGNDRIQLFRAGELNATTVVGEMNNSVLHAPSSVTLDADDCLFIANSFDHRIIRTGPNGVQCIIGCSTTHRSNTTKLGYLRTALFDSFGNIYVTNQDGYGIQKFMLETNSCGKV